MAGEVALNITGLQDVRKALLELAPKLRGRALRNALAAAARVVRDAAKRKTPVISANAYAVRKGYRKPGTLKAAIRVRTSKANRRAGDVGVFVNVRPLKGGRGSKNPLDPFYWRFVNFDINPANFDASAAGRRLRRKLNKQGAPKQRRGVRFMEAGAAQLPSALKVFEATLGPQVVRFQTRAAK